MVPLLTRDSSPPAPHSRSCFVSHAQTMCIGAYTGEGGLTIFGMALRFDLNPPRELPNTFLTALARSAQCTGFYAWIVDALSRARALTISRACCTV
jgi:hypothetical protein